MVLHEDFFGFFLNGQGSPGRSNRSKKRFTLRQRFPEMTKLETVWLRMALKLYRGFEPHARDLLATEGSSFWAIKCILALSCKIDCMVTSAPDELSGPNLTPNAPMQGSTTSQDCCDFVIKLKCFNMLIGRERYIYIYIKIY